MVRSAGVRVILMVNCVGGDGSVATPLFDCLLESTRTRSRRREKGKGVDENGGVVTSSPPVLCASRETRLPQSTSGEIGHK
jgi:hypothetical protein